MIYMSSHEFFPLVHFLVVQTTWTCESKCSVKECLSTFPALRRRCDLEEPVSIVSSRVLWISSQQTSKPHEVQWIRVLVSCHVYSTLPILSVLTPRWFRYTSIRVHWWHPVHFASITRRTWIWSLYTSVYPTTMKVIRKRHAKTRVVWIERAILHRKIRFLSTCPSCKRSSGFSGKKRLNEKKVRNNKETIGRASLRSFAPLVNRSCSLMEGMLLDEVIARSNLDFMRVLVEPGFASARWAVWEQMGEHFVPLSERCHESVSSSINIFLDSRTFSRRSHGRVGFANSELFDLFE